MRRYFHKELEDLRSRLILIGEKANNSAREAVDGFLASDIDKVEDALALDDEIDNLEVEIARAAVRYITLRAPVSSDVRLIFVAIKASHDFERAGDEAHSIAKKAHSILSREGRVVEAGKIREMSEIALSMVSDAISCFVDEDVAQAEAVIARDKEVDRLNLENFDRISKADGPDAPSTATKIETLFISKSIERIGDHAKNLAKEVIYLLTGS